MIFQKSPILNLFSSKGSLTVQFMLGFVLVICFVFIFINMTLTLVASEITQYITYATSRSLFLGHKTKGDQKQAAYRRYTKLVADAEHLKKFFQGGKVFEIADGSNVNLGLNRAPEFVAPSGKPSLFYGAWTEFTPKILDVKTPWGNIEEEDSWFKTVIGSYIGRETSFDECKQFLNQKWQFIKKKHGSVSSSPYLPNYLDYYFDNGC